MKFERLEIPDVILIKNSLREDNRGWFKETYRKDKFHDFGIDVDFVQENVSYSIHNVIRGLHYQLKHPQAKLISVLDGEIFDVAVDIRKNSKTFGKWVGQNLSDDNDRQLYVPEGFAHGFLVISSFAVVCYKCSEIYHPNDQNGIFWKDVSLNISWPLVSNADYRPVVLSESDQKWPCLKDVSPECLF